MKGIQDPRVKYFRNEINQGLEVNRQFGLKHSHGKYITFLDDDDYYTDYDFFAKAIKIFEEHDSESEPLAFVCANASKLIEDTGEMNTAHNIGRPGRVSGLDYILKGSEYRKPLSTFPTVFKVDVLKQAGLYDMIIFDTLTYLEAALYGDAWFMSEYIGVYRWHKESMTQGYKRHSGIEARRFKISSENARRLKMLANNLNGKVEAKILSSWYINKVLGSLKYNAIARPSLQDRMKFIKTYLAASGFMPKLWLVIMKRICKSALHRLKIIK